MAIIKKDPVPKQGLNICALLGRKPTKGEVGLEIEMEGNSFNKHTVPAPWEYHQDGSLRGQDNAEYVLQKPVMFTKVPEALDVLWNMLERHGTVLTESNRTSVHVHLNVQKFHLNRLTTMMAAYFVLEEILTQWCGEYRVGNLFCLRAKDAPAIVSQIRDFITSDGAKQPNSNHHYAAMNANALAKFGSLEFRTLRGVTNPKIILDWVGILQRLYELSAEYEDPRDLVDKFSSEGPIAYFEFLLGDKVPVVRAVLGWSDYEIRESMYEGIRMAQDLCYCRDWKMYEKLEIDPDPFGRSLSKMAAKLAGGADEGLEEAVQAQMSHSPSQQAYIAGSQWGNSAIQTFLYSTNSTSTPPSPPPSATPPTWFASTDPHPFPSFGDDDETF